MQYRKEIDGLRALAVIPVILFHVGFSLFSGGFVGVDVFFVISGYLITSIVLEDIRQGKFEISSFYERRARRILPALFFVLIVTIPVVWLNFLPRDLKDFFQSIVAVSIFSSNILFWRESGYFETDSELKPLLHTWSLAVEEQFYLIFPLFLVFVCRFWRKRLFWSLVAIASVSFLLSEWGWRNKQSANFYLAPTRAWELLAGSISALAIERYGVRSSNVLSILGLLLILFSIFFYSESTPFPSFFTLVPVLGAVLVVVFADQSDVPPYLSSTAI